MKLRDCPLYGDGFDAASRSKRWPCEAVPDSCENVPTAEKAGVHASTIARIEHQGRDETIGSARVVMAILDALRDAGVEVEHDSLRLVPPKKKRK